MRSSRRAARNGGKPSAAPRRSSFPSRDWEREVRVAANQRGEVVIDLEALAPPRVTTTDDRAEMVLADEYVMAWFPGDTLLSPLERARPPDRESHESVLGQRVPA